MDPTWTECPFCESAKGPIVPVTNDVKPVGPSRVRTMVEAPSQGDAGDYTTRLVAEAPAVEKPKPNPQALRPPNQQRPSQPRPAQQQRPPQPQQPKPSQQPKRPAPPVSRDKTRIVGAPPPQKATQGMIVGAMTTFSHDPRGHAFLVRTGRNVLGSAEQASIRTRDTSVSEKHAIIAASDKGIYIDDCLSTNGTFVNDVRLEEKHRLNHGDIIRTGDTLWRFSRIESPEPN